MTAQVIPQPVNIEAIIGAVSTRCSRGHTREAETTMVGYVLWILDQVESHGITAIGADQALAFLDVWVSDHQSVYPFSDEIQELLNQGEILHHYGANDGIVGPDLAYMRKLAAEIPA